MLDQETRIQNPGSEDEGAAGAKEDGEPTTEIWVDEGSPTSGEK